MRKMEEILPELANLPKERDQLVSLFEKDADSVEEKVSVWTKWVETFVTEEVPDDVHWMTVKQEKLDFYKKKAITFLLNFWIHIESHFVTDNIPGFNNPWSSTILKEAINKKYERFIEMLLSNLTEEERTAIDSGALLFDVIEKEWPNVVEVILTQCPEALTAIAGSDNLLPLHCAADIRTRRGEKSMLEILLKKAGELQLKMKNCRGEIVDYVNMLDAKRTTALHIAVRFDCAINMEMLLEHGANPDEVDSYGNTPLHEAAMRCGIYSVTALIERSKLSLREPNRRGDTPLHTAFSSFKNTTNEDNFSRFVVRELLKAGVDINLLNEDGNTPAHLTMLRCPRLELDRCKRLIDLLIGWNADFSVKNEKGLTPLQCLSEWENKEAVLGYLLEKGITLAAPKDNSGSLEPPSETGSKNTCRCVCM